MINLLPSSVREDVTYARRNRSLLHWNVAIGSLLLGVCVLIVGGYVYLNQIITRYDKQVASARQSLEEQKLEETQARVQSISDNVKLINQVLSKQVLFSKLLKEFGSVLPRGTVLERLELTGETSGALDLTALARNFDDATQVSVNFADDKNDLFESVDTVSVACSDSSSQQNNNDSLSSTYPCRINLRVLFNKKNSQFMLINTPSQAAQP